MSSSGQTWQFLNGKIELCVVVYGFMCVKGERWWVCVMLSDEGNTCAHLPGCQHAQMEDTCPRGGEHCGCRCGGKRQASKLASKKMVRMWFYFSEENLCEISWEESHWPTSSFGRGRSALGVKMSKCRNNLQLVQEWLISGLPGRKFWWKCSLPQPECEHSGWTHGSNVSPIPTALLTHTHWRQHVLVR